jgi:hypothetical protein
MSHPTQPVIIKDGVHRFKENKIVRALLEAASLGEKLDLNMIACMDFSQEDRVQLAQLIGYSVAGFGSLSYVGDDAWARASAEEDKMLAAQKP